MTADISRQIDGKQMQDNVHLLSHASTFATPEQSASRSKRDFDVFNSASSLTSGDLRHARTLRKTALQTFLNIGPELVLFSITFPIFALVGTIVRFDGQGVEEPEWSRLQTEIKIVSQPRNMISTEN